MTENQIRETINNFIAAEISDENLAWFPELNADAIRNDPYFHFGEADRHETQESKCYARRSIFSPSRFTRTQSPHTPKAILQIISIQ